MEELKTNPELIDKGIIINWKQDAECILDTDARLRHKENRKKAFWNNLGFLACLALGLGSFAIAIIVIFVWWAKQTYKVYKTEMWDGFNFKENLFNSF